MCSERCLHSLVSLSCLAVNSFILLGAWPGRRARWRHSVRLCRAPGYLFNFIYPVGGWGRSGPGRFPLEALVTFSWAGERLRRSRKTGSARWARHQLLPACASTAGARGEEKCCSRSRQETSAGSVREYQGAVRRLYRAAAPLPWWILRLLLPGRPWVPVATRLGDLPGPCGPRDFRLADAAARDRPGWSGGARRERLMWRAVWPYEEEISLRR
ncbi:hypothetical protein NDU88_003636 [Pleurodeles waltl]|uniref:Uncharacterized protein n=1 Tax=Pleurodeles waltl TaxID=8319 RepID=A0AAV7UZ16_PLEWA|nr:hypothetical protein NDU88_003636 [Pleurodeles waltl]